MDANQKPSKAPKAWDRGSPNPITGRTNAASNGVQAPNKSSSPNATPTAAKDSNTPEKESDKLVYVFANSVGLPSTITTKNGDKFTGIFSSAAFDTPEMRYVLKMVKRVESHTQMNGVTENEDDYAGTGSDHMMIFMKQDVVDLSIHNARFDKIGTKAPNGVSTFRTDTDISGNLAGRERELQKWEPSADAPADMSLDQSSRGWDQFETNARLYGVQTDYDESFYTTTIDKTNPRYKQVEAEAERIAREIEGSSAMNAHVAEERGLKPLDDSGIDEEMKYSGVARSNDFPPLPTGQPNKYTPPARRPPTGQPGVPGVPVDPAIIESSVARPKTNQSHNDERSTDASPAPRDSPESTMDATSQNHQEAAKKDGTAASVTEKPPAVTSTSRVPSAVAGPSTDKTPSKEGGAAATVEKDVYNAFKQFNQGEKMRIIEQQRNKAHHNKTVKLNDLKKFAENFKLHTPVPQDLVPILAKEKTKQDEIVQKALQQVQELKVSPPKQPTPTTAAEQKATKPSGPRNESGVSSPMAPQERQQGQQRSRQNQPNFSQSVRGGERPYQNQIPNLPPRQGPGNLGPRLNITTQQHRAGIPALANIQHPVPIDPRMPPTGPSASSSGVQSPSGTLRFNVKATEFRPNPAAHTFQPSSNPSTGSSPVREPSTRPTETKPPKKGDYLAGKTKEKDSDLETDYNPVVRMEKEIVDQGKQVEFQTNSGIPQAYRTPPTWEILPDNQDKSYDMIFEAQVTSAVSPQPPVVGPPPMPHHQQLPIHLQQGAQMPQMHTPQHTPRNFPVQPHHGGPGGPHHMEDHRMQFSASTSSMQPSPRAMPPFIAYGGQGPQGVPMYQGGMPAYSVSPSAHPMTMRQVSSGPQGFMTPQGPAMGGGHMMANQQSSGPYMQMAPQMQMYSPGPVQVYPHGGPMPPQAGMNGYPSPRPPAPMMAHQGSQQGHPPGQLIYMTPSQGPAMLAQPQPGQLGPMRGAHQFPSPGQFPQGPHPHYPQGPHRGTLSATYIQPMMAAQAMGPGGPQAVVPTGPNPMAAADGEGVK